MKKVIYACCHLLLTQQLCCGKKIYLMVYKNKKLISFYLNHLKKNNLGFWQNEAQFG